MLQPAVCSAVQPNEAFGLSALEPRLEDTAAVELLSPFPLYFQTEDDSCCYLHMNNLTGGGVIPRGMAFLKGNPRPIPRH